MNNFLRFTLIFWVLALCIFSTVPLLALANGDLVNRLNETLNQSSIKQKELSILVTLHAEGKATEVFNLNTKEKFIPASLTKILTAGMSLEKYPVGFRFVTELLATGPVEGGQLKGDLFLKGGGDPSFVSESMWVLVNDFVRSGIKSVEGDLVVDDSRFDSERFDQGRDPQRVDRAYDAPVGAMSFNWNTVNIFVRPGKKKGDKAQVFIDPENSYIQLINKAVTGSSQSKRNLQASRKPNGKSTDMIVISGSIPQGGDEFVIYKGVSHPDLWSAHNLRSFLLKRDISIKGSIRSGRVPLEAIRVAKFESKPIGAIVSDMMKFSNNYVAEMLTKNLAVELMGEPGTMEKGLKVLATYLIEKGFKEDNFFLTSPSGLSRRNQLTADQFFRILEDLRANFTVYPEFVSSLPILGVDGTLKSRMNQSSVKGWVRAKTGMLSGVAGLAGYAGRMDGGIATFVFLFNGKDKKTNVAKSLFDSLARQLVL